MLDPDERTSGEHTDRELFGELSHESAPARFPKLQLAAGKLPRPPEMRSARALRHQYPTRGIEQHPGDDMYPPTGHDSLARQVLYSALMVTY
ncbi:MAG: hypothetical protein OXC08_19155 [Thiotrichales bacterium]|nr:hypothetical protein [Thiotrichales bacterium]